MRNSRRTRMIAWIIAIIMVLCAVPMTSMANIIDSRKNEYEEEYVVNDYAECSVYYMDKDNKTYTTPPKQDQTYTLILNASDTELAQFPKEGELVYYLPERVGTISEIEGNNIASWRQSESGDVIFFTLTDADQGAFTAKITFKSAANVYDLYNLANLNGSGTYYRLRKTYIKTDKELSAKYFGKSLNPEDYEMPEYNFQDETLIYNNKEYYYDCDANAEKIASCGRSYTVTFERLDVIKNKIGAMNGSTPRWLIAENERYNDPNATDSFHANYVITLHEAPYEQVLHNMLKVNNSNDFYRLKKTKIIAKDPSSFKDNEVVKEYTLIPNEEYDFTGVTIELDGEIYEYSPTKLTGEYYSYFTVTPDKIWKKSRINGNADWYNNPKGFLDGSASEFTEANDTISIHRDYVATTYKGTIMRPDLTVKIENSVAHQEKVYSGTEVTLTAVRGGTYTGPVTTTWVRVDPETKAEEVIPEATDKDRYTFIITTENAKYTYKVILTPKK